MIIKPEKEERNAFHNLHEIPGPDEWWHFPSGTKKRCMLMQKKFCMKDSLLFFNDIQKYSRDFFAH